MLTATRLPGLRASRIIGWRALHACRGEEGSRGLGLTIYGLTLHYRLHSCSLAPPPLVPTSPFFSPPKPAALPLPPRREAPTHLEVSEHGSEADALHTATHAPSYPLTQRVELLAGKKEQRGQGLVRVRRKVRGSHGAHVGIAMAAVAMPDCVTGIGLQLASCKHPSWQVNPKP